MGKETTGREREKDRDRKKSDGDAIKICPIFLN